MLSNPTFLVVDSTSDEQTLWCIKNIRYKNEFANIILYNKEDSKVLREICKRYKSQFSNDFENVYNRYFETSSKYLIVIRDLTRIAKIPNIPDDIVGSLDKGCLIIKRNSCSDFNNLSEIKGKRWHIIKNVENKEWWNYPKDDYPIMYPCNVKDVKWSIST